MFVKRNSFVGQFLAVCLLLVGSVVSTCAQSVLNTLYPFSSSTDGANPQAGLIQSNQDHNFYGTTFTGGANGGGTLFSIAPDGPTFNPFYSFPVPGGDTPDGTNPQAALIEDKINFGTFYGTTANGGNGSGTVFQRLSDGTGMTLYAFTALNADNTNT